MTITVLRITSKKSNLTTTFSPSSWEDKGKKQENKKSLFCFYVRNTIEILRNIL